MNSTSYIAPPIPALPYCHPTSPFLLFISKQLHSCIPTPQALLSTTLGVCSITSWLFAQIPQIATNYKYKSTEGLSFLFLLVWCLGDSSNLVGSVLTDQMTFQKVVAGYYVMVDMILLFQFWWYGIIYPHLNKNKTNGSYIQPPRPTRFSLFIAIAQLFRLSAAAPVLLTSSTPYVDNVLEANSFLATITPSPETLTFIGQIISWMSTFFYLSSRAPQLIKNYGRKSTAGLSPILFGAAFSGNFFYSFSLLTNPSAYYNFGPYGGGGWAGEEGSDKATWWINTLPFLIGAAGVLGQDACIGWQFYLWGDGEESKTAIPGSALGERRGSDGEDKKKTKKKFSGIEIRKPGQSGKGQGESDPLMDAERLLGTTANGSRIYGTYSPLSRTPL